MSVATNPTHFESLPEGTKRAFSRMRNAPFLQDYYLAGGTALALWLGHRISADLDFFTDKEFFEKLILDQLPEFGTFRLEKKAPDTIIGSLDGVRVSFFRYPYPCLESLAVSNGVHVASVLDIACMKLDAIASRGTKRDFVDLYIIAQRGMPLAKLMDAYSRKYERLHVNLLHVKKSLVFFDDANPEPDLRMLKEILWEDVKTFFRVEVMRL